MKQRYFLNFLCLFCFGFLSFSQTPIITMIADGDCTGGNPKVLEIYASGTVDFTQYTLQNQTNTSTIWGANQDLSSLGTVTNGFVYIVRDSSDPEIIGNEFPSITASQKLYSNTVNVNGDDRLRIIKTSDETVIDVYGVDGEDGSGKAWEYADGYAKRKNGTAASNTFSTSDWVFANGDLNGKGTCQGGSTFESIIQIGTYSVTASTNPSLTITSPTEGSVFDNVTSVDVKITVANFTVASPSTGDGFIKWKLDGVAQTDKTDTNDMTITVAPGNSYVLYMELVDNSGNPLSTPVNKTVNFSVKYPCSIQVGAINTTCDATTSGMDSYSATIAYTGGNTGVTYTISTATTGVTIAGDNPNTVAEGTITVSGMQEGTDVVVQFKGGAGSSCDFTRTIKSPTCIPFPVVETFDYAVGSNLGDQTLWTNNNSGDEIIIATGNLSYSGLKTSAGNMATFAGLGTDPYISFNTVNSGTVYASFIFNLPGTEIANGNVNGGYFAIFGNSPSTYNARLWVKSSNSTPDYLIGVSEGGTATNFITTALNSNAVNFVIMGYDFSTNKIKVWLNPDAASLGGTTIPAPTLTEDIANVADIKTFILRQDSDTETPQINVDELRIGTTWAQVTPTNATASVGNNKIDGFRLYPNPVTNKEIEITTSSNAPKKIEIVNLLGKSIFSKTFEGANRKIKLTNIHSGVYIVKVVEGKNISTKKLIVE